jgi:hypothetical protein
MRRTMRASTHRMTLVSFIVSTQCRAPTTCHHVGLLLSTAPGLTDVPIKLILVPLVGRTKVPDLGRSAASAAPLPGEAYSQCLARTDVRLDPISSTN